MRVACCGRAPDRPRSRAWCLSGPMPASDKRRRDVDVGRKARRRPRARCPRRSWSASRKPSTSILLLDDVRRAEQGPSAGLRVIMRTEWISPSAAAVTASRPSSAPVGTTIWPPFSFASSTRSQLRQQRAGAEHHHLLAGVTNGSTMPRRIAAGAHSTTRSACASGTASGLDQRAGDPLGCRARPRLVGSRAATAASASPAMPSVERRRAPRARWRRGRQSRPGCVSCRDHSRASSALLRHTGAASRQRGNRRGNRDLHPCARRVGHSPPSKRRRIKRMLRTILGAASSACSGAVRQRPARRTFRPAR